MLEFKMKGLFLLAIFCSTTVTATVEEDARKVLSSKCGACHGQSAMGGLRIDSPEGFAKGGKSGRPAIELLLTAVKGGGGGIQAMPPGQKLTTAELATLESWVAAGAKFPTGHWAWKPLQPASGSIDAHVDARLKGIVPAAPADRRTLIRRIYFDLTGLPPTSPELDVADGWQSRLVDKLLNSPHFGEHWGRHWMDIARYGEDDFSGTAVQPYPHAWRYRDWVIGAFNRNLPYNRFLIAQLAGDLTEDKREVGGLGLTGLGPWYYGITQPPQARADERHDRVDLVSRGMLGVTVACARCHDHKYDPFTQKDYYALSGVFASTAYKEYPLVPEAEAAAWQANKKLLDDAEKKLSKFLDEQAARLRDEYAPGLYRYMVASRSGDVTGLNLDLFNRWCDYLKKPEDNHPLLKDWFAAPNENSAKAFEQLIRKIAADKKQLDIDNKVILDAAAKVAVKPKRTIVLPGGYRSEEDFNPGAEIPIKALPRDQFVAYNRVYTDGNAPLRFPPDLAPKFLIGEYKSAYDALLAERDRLKKALPPKYQYFDGIGEFESIDLNLDKRGNPEDPGDVVPRRFPLVLSQEKNIPLRHGSGRLELARTVASHPLAARVAVNRIWMHLFGEGIVRTPSNFGVAGDRPGNPELLEYLAARFVQLGYDQKALIKEIILSKTYQRSSNGDRSQDPDNRLWARQNRRRLAAEPLRDAMLATSGRLDPQLGGASQELNAKMQRRTVYAKVGRFEANETLSLFDHPNAAVTCEQRVITNVPLQKLFYLNSEMVMVEAQALGKRLEGLGIDGGYQLMFQRTPTAAEKQAAKDFFDAGGNWTQYAQVLLSSNEFAYVD